MEETELEKIIRLYQDGMSVRKIGKEIGRTQPYVEIRLKKEGVYKNSKGEIFKGIQNEEIEMPGFHKIAVCKKTGKEFDDFENSSGCLTKHIRAEYPEIIHPSKFIKNSFFIKTGKYWHQQFFDIKKIPTENIYKRKCPYCDWTTVDIDNKSGWYRTHLEKVHKMALEDHIKSFPEQKVLFATYFDRLEYKKEMLSDKDNQVECLICHEMFYKINNTHLMSVHGITADEYKEKYSDTTMSTKTSELYKQNYDKKLRFIPSNYTSKAHQEIMCFLSKRGVEVVSNDKKILGGTEIDIFIPDKKLAIEYNGLFYHSEIGGKKNRLFHYNKTKLCKENNISLIHIFEDDWIKNPNLIKNKIAHIIGISSAKSIHARKCVIKKIPQTQKDIFLETNHIQGASQSNVNYGAFFNDELVSVMTFDNKRYMSKHGNKEQNFELTRFCVKMEYKISGIASKLLKIFINEHQPKHIISFADSTWTITTENNLYTKLGFKQEGTLPPDYKYVNLKVYRNKRLHKFNFGKSSIKKRFPLIYDPSKTEWEMMQEAGYDRIWDCGKIRYVMSFD